MFEIAQRAFSGHRILLGFLLVFIVGCSADSTKSRSNYAFNRIIGPITSKALLDEEYKQKAETLNGRYYYLLGEYLARKRDLRGALQALERARQFNESEPEIYYSLAGVYTQLGKLEEGEALLRRTLELAPSHTSAMLDLAQLLKTSNETNSEVEDLLKKAWSLDPSSDQAAFGLVEAYISSKQILEAKKLLQSFVKTKPDSYLGHFYLGVLEQEAGNLKKAVFFYDKALEIRPEFSRAAAFLGQIYEKEKKYDQALKIYEAASRSSDGSSLYRPIAEIYLQKDQKEKAVEAFEAYLESYPSSADIVLRTAFLHLELKNLDTAEKHFLSLSKLKPEFTAAQYFIGLLHEERKDYPKAIKALNLVKAGAPVYVDSVRALARIYSETKQYDKGLRVLEKAFAVLPNTAVTAEREQIYVEMISILSKSEDHKKATEVASSGLKMFPESESVQLARAVAMDEAGDAFRAAKDLQAFLSRTKSSNPSILNFVGYVYADNGYELDLAERYIRQALVQKPQDPYITDSLGWVLYKKGQFKQAESYLRKALMGAPTEAVILEHLADCLVKLGSLQEANELYAKAVSQGHKKTSDQKRLVAKQATLQQKLSSMCAFNIAGSDCGVLREQRNPAAQASQNP